MAFRTGEAVVCRATFTDPDDDSLIDPSTPVTCTVLPAGAGTADAPIAATQISTGVYEAIFTNTGTAGVYYYRFESADNAVEEGEFEVLATTV